MLELPEVITIARQMNAELRGKRIKDAVSGTSPHKFAFYNHPAKTYAEVLRGKTVGEVTNDGGFIFTALEPGWTLLLGEMGGRILFHRDATTLPKKHQLLVHFEDGEALTVTIQMWGGIQLVPKAELSNHPRILKRALSPLSPDFTYAYFEHLLADPVEREKKSVKFFIISKPGISGVGNGCLHNILFRAKIHPKRLIVNLTSQEQQTLYDATRGTLMQMVEKGGRDTEHDLYNHPGGYKPVLDSRTNGTPCPACGTPIEKIFYLGGAAYFCPHCQV